MSGERIDSLGMFDAMLRTPEQMVAAVEAAQDLPGLPAAADIDNVLVLGVGDSGTAGDLLTVTAGPFMPVPVVVVRSFVPPSYVNERTLVFAISFSGNTTETLEAADSAAELGGNVVAVTTGGVLADRAAIWGTGVVAIDPAIPGPRAAFPSLAVAPLIVLEDVGLFRGATQWVIYATEQLRRRRNELAGPGSVARRLAEQIDHTAPLVQGGGGIGKVAADRWKTQMNASAKMPAFSSALPDAGHYEVEGWARDSRRARDALSIVQLRHGHEHPLVERAFEVVTEMVRDRVATVVSCQAEGEGPVAQMFDLMMLGDAVSLELAALEGVDPGPAPAVDELERRLAE